VIHLIVCLLATDLSAAGRLYTEGRYQDAATAYSQALRDTPTSVQALLGMGKSLIGLGDPRKALSYLEQAKDLDRGNREIRRTWAHALAESHQFFPAEEALKQLTAADPKDAESWYYLGALYYKSGYYGAALPDFEHSVGGQPGNSQAAIYRAVCLAKLGRAADAEEAFLKLLENPANERDPDLLLTYAELLYDVRRTNEALSRVNQALRAMPESSIAYFWKAKILFGSGQLKPAVEAAEKSVVLTPELPVARVLLMNIYQALGRTEDAEAQAGWLRRREPDAPSR
jgi:tetratricopeptide (TPR) repeat protein